MEPISVRRVRAEDWRRLRDLRLRGLHEDPDAFGSTYAETRKRPEAFWRAWAADHAQGDDRCTLLAFSAAAAGGLVRCQREPERPAIFAVYSMWVAPELRRRGAGLALLEAAERFAAAGGGRAIELTVMEDAAPARALYERAGFRLDGRREPTPNRDVDELGMRRDLAPAGG
jgi:ribosomal protein S18 acetylase RimI-like enzyme